MIMLFIVKTLKNKMLDRFDLGSLMKLKKLAREEEEEEKRNLVIEGERYAYRASRA